MNEFQIANGRALITGGGTGLGRGIAKALVAAGSQVCLTGRRLEPLQETQKEIGAEVCAIVVGDVTKADDRKRMLREAEELMDGVVTILINNAGNHLKKPAIETNDAEFDLLMQTHVSAAFALSREVYSSMKAAGHGSIVMLASMASYMGVPNIVAYTTAKTAVVGLTRALAAEWSAENIRVNAIAPGWIESPMMRQALDNDPPRKQRILDRTPMYSFGQASDIGAAVTYLCSPAARFVTGTLFPVDGGASIGF